MKNLDVNIFISLVLGIMGLTAVIIWGLISYKAGTSSGTELPLSISSTLGGVLTGKGISDLQHHRELQKGQEPPVLPGNNLESKV